MSQTIHAYAALAKGDKLKPFEYEPGALHEEQVEIAVESCGLCHSDLSMLNNDWGVSQYPFVPGHEVIGKIVAVGDHVTERKVGERVGLGWFSGSCMKCSHCLTGTRTSASSRPTGARRRSCTDTAVSPTASARTGSGRRRCGEPGPGQIRAAVLRRHHRLQPDGSV